MSEDAPQIKLEPHNVEGEMTDKSDGECEIVLAGTAYEIESLICEVDPPTSIQEDGDTSHYEDNLHVNDVSGLPFKIGDEGWHPSKLSRRAASKLLREQGLAYKNRKGLITPARRVRPNVCKETCRHKCTKNFQEEDRKNIHSKYWSMPTIQKKDFLLKCLYKSEKARDTVGGTSRRKFTRTYTLPLKNNHVVVCRGFFLSTLDVGEKMLRCTEKTQSLLKSAVNDKKGTSIPSNKTPPRSVKTVKGFIKSIPTVDCNYCKSSSQVKYLPEELGTMSFYRVYCDHCITH